MAETWTYQIRTDASTVFCPHNAQIRMYIKRTYPTDVTTSMYSQSSSYGRLSSSWSLRSYSSDTQLTFGPYGTTDKFAKDTSEHQISDMYVSDISSFIVSGVGTTEQEITVTVSHPGGSGNGIVLYHNLAFTLSVSVEKSFTKSSATMASDAYFGGLCTVTFSNPGISYVSHKVTWTMTDHPGASRYATSDVGKNSIAITIPSGWASNIADSTSAKCTVTVETFYGSTSLGSNSYSITLNIPNTAVPTITNVSISVYNDKTLDTMATTKGIFIQGVTGVRLSVSASADSGATISSYRFASSVGGFTQNNNQYYSNVQNTSGNISFTITVTDSRGKTATTTKTITVHAYNKPTITNASAFRCLEDGTPSENGTYATIKATANMTSVYDDTGKQFNSITLKSTYFRATTGTPSQTTAVDNMENGKEYKNIGGSFSSLYQYYIRFTATDAISGATYIDVNISSAAFAIHIHNGGSGVAFGKTSEESHTVQVTENWTPKWGTYTMPGIVYGSYVSNPPASQVGIIWLKPKS